MTDLSAALLAAEELTDADVALAANLTRQCRESDPHVAAAVALTLRALREGSICCNLTDADAPLPELVDHETVRAALSASPMVTQGADSPAVGPVRLVDDALYLERYWGYQESVRRSIVARRGPCDDVDPARLREGLDAFFHGEGLDPHEPDLQRRAVALSLLSKISFIAGGPGTGKTTTLARLLAVADRVWEPSPRIALAAPTGKAAARLSEAVGHLADPQEGEARGPRLGLQATTLHRLLESRGSASRFGYGPHRRLPHDLIIVDETSMVSILMMERLLSAVKRSAHLVFVGDPYQLTSVEAGAVLSDIVAADLAPQEALTEALLQADADGFDRRGLPCLTPPPGIEVVTLRHNYRFLPAIADVAHSIHAGEVDTTVELVTAQSSDPVHLFDEHDPAWIPRVRERCVDYGLRLAAAAHTDPASALAILDEHRLLCGHRHGPAGVSWWMANIHGWLREAGLPMSASTWAVGQPIMASVNQPELGVFNGDTGVIVDTPDGPQAAFRVSGDVVTLAPTLLDGAVDAYAMTVHKSQGSQFRHVTLLLPPTNSPLLTRSLVYTALTRAQESVTMIGSVAALTQAVEHDVRRASGLQRRLAQEC